MPGGATRGRRGVLLLASVVAVIGVILIVVGVRAQQRAPHPHDAGRIQPDPPATGHPATGSGSSGSSTPRRGRGPLGPSRPVRIQIPAIGVNTPVNPIGLAPDGTLAVPQPGPHLNQAAWFKNSPTPGQPGPAIIEGHVDSVQGVSVFFRLGAIKPGDTIQVRRADGVRVTFTVNAVRDFKKASFPTKVVYGGDLSTPQLRLITCSDFDESLHHHVGNEVVFSHLTHVDRPSGRSR